jgi:hypothetical protein
MDRYIHRLTTRKQVIYSRVTNFIIQAKEALNSPGNHVKSPHLRIAKSMLQFELKPINEF